MRMCRNFIVAGACVLASAGVLSGRGSGQIGVIVPLTGVFAERGERVRDPGSTSTQRFCARPEWPGYGTYVLSRIVKMTLPTYAASII
jgi:hypothetical protein